ncbi:MAG: TonB-dependent receptor [Acidobacteriota bacterium]|nr:TonB-dependent receptor [Acidobacteriota bacterium]
MAALATASPLHAQETGTVRGTVTLVENGGPVDGALILIIGTGAFTFTDDGTFEFTSVPAGTYDVIAQREQLTAGLQTVSIEAGETAIADFELSLSPVREEVTVTASAAVGAAATLQAFNAVTTVDSFEIAREAPSTIAEALEDEPGIANRSFGPGASRPVIRGFGGDRVLIIEDGLPTGDLSATSDHHGMTVDPNSAERIEIVRGPATLLYGSSVVGGLINIITPHAAYRNLLTPPESYGETLIDGTRAQLGADTGSANRQAGTYANLQHAQGNMLYWGSGAQRRTGDYKTPEGPVLNTAAELTNARTGLGYFGDRAFASLSLTFEDSRFGLPFGEMFHSHGQDDGGHGHSHGHDEEETAGSEDDAALDLSSRRRVGRFDLGLRNLDNDFLQGVRTGFHVIDVTDAHVDTAGGTENIHSRIGNRNFIKRTLFYQRQLGRFTGRFGTELKFRDFHPTGAEALAPRTDQSTLSAFGYEEVSFGRFRLQFAGRAERNDYKIAARVAPPGQDDADDRPGPPDPRDRQFLGVSASAGLHADIGAATAFVANLMRSHRVPALQELYNFGPHLGNFEVGDPDLDAETTLGLDLGLRHQSGRVGTDLNFYVYDIENFIFGNHTTEVMNNLRVLDIIQGDSRVVGFDARGSVRLGGQTWASIGIGYVNATLTSTNEAVPRIPPLRATLSIDVPYGAFTVSPELMLAARQGRVFRDETTTPGYAVLNLDASYIWPRQHMAHVLSFTGYNLTNALFRNHMSFIKDLAPEMGRGVKLGYSLRFF